MIAYQKTKQEELCKTMKKRKLMMTVMSLALVLVVAVGGTLAYLSDQSNEVTNTFNVGEGYIPDDPDDPDSHKGLWLDETDKPATGGNPLETDPNHRTETGVAYEEMMPGSVVAKDPTFHLTNNSTTSYVFANVTGVDEMIAAGYFFTVNKPEALTDPSASAFNDNWVKVDDAAGFNGWYVYVVDNAAGEDAVKYGVVSTKTGEEGQVTEQGTEMASMFNYVKLGSSVDNEEFAAIGPGEVVIGGVAVQTTNLTMEEAFAEAQSVWDEAHNTTGTDEPVEP